MYADFCALQADGRLIHVYYKAGGGFAPSATRGAAASAPSGPRARTTRDTVVDGSLSFEDPMETDRGYVIDTGRPRHDNRPQNGLYSDSLVQSGGGQQHPGGVRGRGRGRRSGPGR